MGVAENKAAVQRFVDEVMSAGSLAALDELVTADCVDHTPPSPEFSPGRAGVRAQMDMLGMMTQLDLAPAPDAAPA